MKDGFTVGRSIFPPKKISPDRLVSRRFFISKFTSTRSLPGERCHCGWSRVDDINTRLEVADVQLILFVRRRFLPHRSFSAPRQVKHPDPLRRAVEAVSPGIPLLVLGFRTERMAFADSSKGISVKSMRTLPVGGVGNLEAHGIKYARTNSHTH